MTSRRCFYRMTLLATFGCAVSGCAGKQLSLGNAFSRDKGVETVSTQPAPRDVALDTAAERASKPTPFLDAPKNGIQMTSAEEAVAASASDDGPKHDSATLMLIESEFRDASAEERAEWYEILRDVEPSMVPMLLRVRRLRSQRKEMTSPAQTASLPDASAEPSPHEFVTPTSNDVATNPVVQPGPQPVTERHPLAPDVTPRTVDKPARPTSPVAEQPAAMRPSGVETVAATSPEVPRSTAPPTVKTAEATWPPNDSPAPVRQTGYVRMPTEAPAAEQTATTAKQDGTYALANSWDVQLQRLIGLMESEIAKQSTPVGDEELVDHAKLHTYLRMLYLMDGQQTRSLQAIPDMPPAHQEFWTQLFWGLTNYFDREGIPDSGHRATETITQLRAAVEKLKPETRLQLRNATFSHKINSFGSYERFERDEFRAGQPVLVYLEVQNFASELNSEAMYKTRLRTSIEIHKAGRGPDAGPVHTQEFPATEDTCRNLRQDYFHSYRIDLPENLTPGPHVLKLMVEDELSHRMSTTSLNFVVQ